MDLPPQEVSVDLPSLFQDMHSICRCCLAENATVENMVNSEETPSLYDYYRELSNVELEADKDYTKICQECAGQLRTFWSFRLQIIESNQKFKERLIQLLDVKLEEPSDEDSEIVYETAADEQFSQVFVKDNTTRRLEVKPTVVEVNEKDNESDVEESFQADMPADSEPETIPVDVSTIEATYLCFYCDGVLNTHKDYVQHRDDHIKERSSNRLNRHCHLCDEDVVGYFRHLEDKHRDYRPNVCKLCPNGRFQSQNSLKNHLYSHTDTSIYKCLACNKTFKNQYNLRCHISTEKHSKHSYHCPYCGLGFVAFLDLHEHFKTGHADKIFKKLYPCYKCKKVFMFKKYAVAHECDLKVVEKRTDEMAHNCDRCEAQFGSHDELVCHQFLVCEEEPQFICPICQKVCLNSQRLSEHKRSHENHIYVCDECGHSTTSEPKLLRHKITHTSARHFQCNLCPATFKNKYSLRTHNRIHIDRKYECFLCCKKFRFYNTIKQHMATHTEASSLRKFNCDFCDKTFVRPRDKERHLKIHTDDRPMKCSSCSKQFRDTGALNEHFKRVHQGVYYECSVCSKKYVRKMELNEHFFVHRGFKPFNCPECSQGFIKKWVMKKHLKTHGIIYCEKLHGYREKENLQDLIASSVRVPRTGGLQHFEQDTWPKDVKVMTTVEGPPNGFMNLPKESVL